MDEHGWPFASVDKFPGADIDPLIGAEHVKDIYLKADPNFEGRFVCVLYAYGQDFNASGLLKTYRFTVPVLWDKKQNTIVNNESSEIIRILNTAFNDLLPPEKAAIDLYPKALGSEIDGINEWVYDYINS